MIWFLECAGLSTKIPRWSASPCAIERMRVERPNRSGPITYPTGLWHQRRKSAADLLASVLSIASLIIVRMRPKVLVIQNAEWEGPGLVESYARAAGLELEVVELFRPSVKEAPIPFEALEKGAFAGVVALGSPSTAYIPESNPHHEQLIRLFKLVRKTKTPSFDIC